MSRAVAARRVSSTVPAVPGDPLRWWALVVIAVAQLTVLLDTTIVNIALPSAQQALGLTDGNRQWVVTAYALAFGGLLLLGGRVVDMVGRKRSFLLGLVGFAAASAVGGAAGGPAVLLGARAVQGAFAALLAPASLALLVTTFTEPRERGRAFGVIGTVSGVGAAGGLILGGLLTEYLDWRWCMYVNVPIALAAAAAGLWVLREGDGRRGSRLDLLGALLGCGGLTALVLGFGRAEGHGWGSASVVGALAGGVVLLWLFVLRQRRAAHPLVPLHVVADRDRAGALVVAGLAPVATFGLLLFLTYYLQVARGFSAVAAGLALLPLTVGMTTGVNLAVRLGTRGVPPFRVVACALLLGSGGVALLARTDTGSSYPAQVLPAMLLAGIGLGATGMTAMATATSRVAPADSGTASALFTTAQQIGASVGTSVINTVAASAAAGHLVHLAGPAARADATVYGFTVALWGVVGLLGLSAVVTAVLLGRPVRRATGLSDRGAAPLDTRA
ncbi:MFS transporter [Kitasatospora sp. LaBMicrA B282]|uniref:MFS transporter n=1 Tax=Kitasatospora sp. LaBMicrA B282 TaxID=3420949 RepID=UPI003D0F2E4B